MKITGSANELSHKEEQIAYYGGKNNLKKMVMSFI